MYRHRISAVLVGQSAELRRNAPGDWQINIKIWIERVGVDKTLQRKGSLTAES